MTDKGSYNAAQFHLLMASVELERWIGGRQKNDKMKRAARQAMHEADATRLRLLRAMTL